MQSLTLWRNSSSDVNDAIFEGNARVNTEKKPFDFAGGGSFFHNLNMWLIQEHCIFVLYTQISLLLIEQLMIS